MNFLSKINTKTRVLILISLLVIFSLLLVLFGTVFKDRTTDVLSAMFIY